MRFERQGLQHAEGGAGGRAAVGHTDGRLERGRVEREAAGDVLTGQAPHHEVVDVRDAAHPLAVLAQRALPLAAGLGQLVLDVDQTRRQLVFALTLPLQLAGAVQPVARVGPAAPGAALGHPVALQLGVQLGASARRLRQRLVVQLLRAGQLSLGLLDRAAPARALERRRHRHVAGRAARAVIVARLVRAQGGQRGLALLHLHRPDGLFAQGSLVRGARLGQRLRLAAVGLERVDVRLQRLHRGPQHERLPGELADVADALAGQPHGEPGHLALALGELANAELLVHLELGDRALGRHVVFAAEPEQRTDHTDTLEVGHPRHLAAGAGQPVAPAERAAEAPLLIAAHPGQGREPGIARRDGGRAGTEARSRGGQEIVVGQRLFAGVERREIAGERHAPALGIERATHRPAHAVDVDLGLDEALREHARQRRRVVGAGQVRLAERVAEHATEQGLAGAVTDARADLLLRPRVGRPHDVEPRRQPHAAQLAVGRRKDAHVLQPNARLGAHWNGDERLVEREEGLSAHDGARPYSKGDPGPALPGSGSPMRRGAFRLAIAGDR